MRHAVLSVALVVLMISTSALLLAHRDRSERDASEARLRCTSVDAARVLGVWEARGVVRSVRGGTVEVVTLRWAAAGHDAQISIGIAAYCQIADGRGRGTIIVRGSLGDDLGGVVDGNWMR